MRTLVLGGSVFVGKHTVEALLAGGHDVAVLNRGGRRPSCPTTSSGWWPTAPTSSRCGDALDGRDWDAVFDVSGFVMAAGGSDIEGLLDLLDGPCRPLRLRQLDHGLRPVAGRDLPVDRGPADQPRRAGQLRRVQGRRRGGDARPPPRHGFPATIVRPAAIYGPDNNIFDMELPMFLRLLEHRPILVPHGGLVVGSYGHVDDLCEAMVAMVGNPAAIGEVFNITGESVTVNRYIDVLADVVGEEPDVVYLPDSMLGEPLRSRVRPPVRRPPPRHGEHREGASSGSASRAATTSARATRTPTTGSVDKGYADVDGPMVDPMWRASWDFDAEAAVAAAGAAVHEPTDAEMWRSVEATVRDVLLPAHHRRLGAGDRRPARRDGPIRRHASGRPDCRDVSTNWPTRSTAWPATRSSPPTGVPPSAITDDGARRGERRARRRGGP